MEEYVYKLYEAFFIEINKRKHIKNKKDNLIIKTYFESTHQLYGKESLGTNFFIEYLQYQFWYWSDKKINTQYFSLNWFFGQKAVERFNKIKNGWKYYCNQYFQSNFPNLFKKIDQIEKPVLKIIEKEDLFSFESIQRKRFLNQDVKGLFYCIENTTLFDIGDEACQNCHQKDSCKELLKKNYLKLYISRYGNK